jgi:hypothetical protein
MVFLQQQARVCGAVPTARAIEVVGDPAVIRASWARGELAATR